ncbi:MULTISPECIES: hypothetical protein [unclassified Pseudoclavibacter]|uniref:hypothetical protein n=1 Tax=unclassified Pseudoclavibacter TaxID=2615177 RepID=UPI0011B00DDF|nr:MULTISPECIES: hypothetical protein [unclassified Pseudoclavibacter]
MRITTRVSLAAVVLVLIGIALGVATLFSWMVNETHFDRPTAQFDEFADRVEALPGVSDVQHERWVEAPLFVDPISWVGVDVEQEHLPGLLAELCASAHPEAISWSIDVAAAAGGETSLHSQTDSSRRSLSGGVCPSFGFDAVPLVDALDAVVPGLAVQPSIWENGRFALVSIAEAPNGYLHLLPLVENTEALLAAAGLEQDQELEINSTTLGASILPGQQEPYLALLTELAERHEVSFFWADGGGTPIDGVERVNITAPASQHSAIESAIGASGLHIADFPVEFQEP